MHSFIRHLAIASFLACSLNAQAQQPVSTLSPIALVDEVQVSAHVGTVPCLPYRLWVRYADGTGEWRTVRWTNADIATEQRQASAELMPAGAAYDVEGYIVGDDATAEGYPVVAHVSVTDATPSLPAPQAAASFLPLGDVSLCLSPDSTGALTQPNRLTLNRDLDIAHLLALDVRQQLYNYRDTYGLPTEGYPEADGWDSPTTKLKGHGTGHYMSALALAYASTRDKAVRRQLLERMRTVVTELRRCQAMTFVHDAALGRYREARDLAPEAELRELQGTWDAFNTYKGHPEHFGYGYIGAIPPQHCVLIEMYRPYNNEQWVWAPYYTVHKLLAGLTDIATLVDDRKVSAMALLIARDMGLWVWNRMHYRTYVDASGTQASRRSRPGNRYEMWNMYIAGEVGGMAESLARIAQMVSSPTDRDRLIEAARAFDSPAFFDPLAQGIDALRGRHANQHIPMAVGAARIYRATGDAYYYRVAHAFWHHVQGRYRYAMGGVGNGEMFREPYTQMLAMDTNTSTDWRDGSMQREPTLNETCCAYNMAKLSRELACLSPTEAAYMDYHERVLYNQIVGSLHPDSYAVLYQYAVGLDASKPWGNETPQSTCCGGTGAENHVRYQEAAYLTQADTLYVALYMPTRARWRRKGVELVQECQWPAEQSTLRITHGHARFALRLRVPEWATKGFDIQLNGRSLAQSYQPSSYVTIPCRQWSRGDSVVVRMPFPLHIDFAPDRLGDMATGQQWCGALMRGPLVLCAQGIASWDDATLTRGTFQRWVQRATVPDYAADAHVTHYFRLAADADAIAGADSGAAIGMLAGRWSAARRQAESALTLASARRQQQEAWMQMDVRVPDYAPWAPYAYARMCTAMDSLVHMLGAEAAVAAEADGTVQREALARLTRTAATLRSTLAAMRPGNLPEPENLTLLQQLLQQARSVAGPSVAQREAMDYGEMVVRYVSDGSGTHDMIARAVRQLQDAMR